MGINKIEFNGNVIMDLTEDTVTPETLAEGVTAHNKAGDPIIGTMSVDDGNDYFVHVKCSPEYQAGDDANGYYVFDPHMMTIAEWSSLRSDGKNIKLKVEIGTIDDVPVELIASRVIPPEGVTGNQMFSADYNGSKYDFGLTTDRTYVIIQCHEPVAYMTSDNMVTELTPEVTDDQYPSALAVRTAIQDAIADVGSGDGGGGGTSVKEIFNVKTSTNEFEEEEIDCSFADLLAAINAEKLIVFNGNQATVTSVKSTQVKIAFWKKSGHEEWTISSDGITSSTESKLYLTPSETTTTINASSTHGKVPTAKAVYDFVQNNAGGGADGSDGDSNTFTFDFALSFDTGDMVISLPSTVTFAELVEKFNAGVHVVGYLKLPSSVPTVGGTHALPMTSANIDAVFTALLGYTDLIITVKQDGSASYTMRLPTYTIDENSTDDQKPSAKAVYDLVMQESDSCFFFVECKIGATGFELDGITYDDVMAAYNAGKRLIARLFIPSAANMGMSGQYEAPLSSLNESNVFVFTLHKYAMTYELYVLPDNRVLYDVIRLLFLEEDVTTKIDNKSTDNKMPTAKAVYDFVQANAGGADTEVFHVSTVSDDSGVQQISCSFDELFAAVESEKIIIFNARQTILLSRTAKKIRIAVLQRDGYEEWTIKQDGSATEDYSESYVSYTNKSEAINESSTDDQWASAKAVYDFVNSNSGGGSANSPLVLEMVNVNGDYLELPEGVTYNDIVNAYNAGRQVIARVTSLSGNCKMSLNLFAIVPRYPDNLASMGLWFTAFCPELYGTFIIYDNGEIELIDGIEIIMNM